MFSFSDFCRLCAVREEEETFCQEIHLTYRMQQLEKVSKDPVEFSKFWKNMSNVFSERRSLFWRLITYSYLADQEERTLWVLQQSTVNYENVMHGLAAGLDF